MELQNNAGIICGADVDKLIWTPSRGEYTNAKLPASLNPRSRLPGEPKGDYL